MFGISTTTTTNFNVPTQNSFRAIRNDYRSTSMTELGKAQIKEISRPKIVMDLISGSLSVIQFMCSIAAIAAIPPIGSSAPESL